MARVRQPGERITAVRCCGASPGAWNPGGTVLHVLSYTRPRPLTCQRAACGTSTRPPATRSGCLELPSPTLQALPRSGLDATTQLPPAAVREPHLTKALRRPTAGRAIHPRQPTPILLQRGGSGSNREGGADKSGSGRASPADRLSGPRPSRPAPPTPAPLVADARGRSEKIGSA